MTRQAMLARIRANIEQHGHHVYMVTGGQSPRFAYTIGVSPEAGAEVVLAGAAAYSNADAKRIIDTIASMKAPDLAPGSITIDSLGTFSLRTVDASWSSILVLGALDYYRTVDLPVLQVVPDDEHWTADVPDLSQRRSLTAEPAWRWLTEPWEYAVSDRSVAVTNLDALRGMPVTEAVRWEDEQWELFAGAGPDVPPHEIREVPLGTLLALDPSLVVVTTLGIGEGLWRDPIDRVWHVWGD